MGKQHYEMRFAGSGGQGMMLMGDIMAQAAGGLDTKEIVLTVPMARKHGEEPAGLNSLLTMNRLIIPACVVPILFWPCPSRLRIHTGKT